VENADAISGLRALADATRLQVARLLVEGAFSVGEIQEVLALGQSTVSHHLKVLSEAGLLECRREGRLAWYGWHASLSPAQQALRAFVQSHARTLDIAARQRLSRVFEARTERTKRFFDTSTSPFEQVPASTKGPAPAVDVVQEMVALLPKCEVAVDLGTGTGRLLAPLRERAGRIIGVDQSPRMLEGARRRVSERGWHDVELRLGSLEHLPLADAEADVAIAHQVLHHVARPEAVAAEAHRVLRAGGLFVIADYLPHDREWMREEYADLWLGFDPSFVLRLLEDAGFVDVTVSSRAGEGEELGMFVAAGRRGPSGPALESRHTKNAPRPSRAGRKTMRDASHTRRRRTAARGEHE
jgi:ArsR family transcriptional regulator